PCGIRETPVAVRSVERRMAGCDAHGFAEQLRVLAAHDTWFRREATDQRRRSREDVLATNADERIRRKRVLCCVLGEHGWRAANAAGTARSLRRRGGCL